MKKKQTEYQRKKKRGLALASAYVDADLWEQAAAEADRRNESMLKAKYTGKWTRSDILREALERLLNE